MLGAVRRCTRILWPGKTSEKTPRGEISHVYVKYHKTHQKKKKKNGVLNPNGYSVNPDIAAVCIPGKKDDSAFLASMVSSAKNP
jgi:hypothetical protein